MHRLANHRLRDQILVVVAVLFTITQPLRAASFQVTGVTPPAAFSCPSAQSCTATVVVQGQGFNNLTGCVQTCFVPFVRFGDAIGVITDITDTQVTVLLPVHSPGTVDVTVVGPTGSESTLPAGFTFLDPAAIPAVDKRTAALLAAALALIGSIALARLP